MSFHSVLALEKNYHEYKENFDFILEMPFIQKLLRENRKLKKENKRLVKFILNQDNKDESCQLCKCSPIEPIDLTVEEDVSRDSKENILYNITEIPTDEVHIKKEEEEEEDNKVHEITIGGEKWYLTVEHMKDSQIYDEESDDLLEKKNQEPQLDETVQVKKYDEDDSKFVYEESDDQVEEMVDQADETVEEVSDDQVEETVDQEDETETVEEDDEVYEVTINGKSFYVTNEKDSVIYGLDENGDISVEAGKYVNGNPIFT